MRPAARGVSGSSPSSTSGRLRAMSSSGIEAGAPPAIESCSGVRGPDPPAAAPCSGVPGKLPGDGGPTPAPNARSKSSEPEDLSAARHVFQHLEGHRVRMQTTAEAAAGAAAWRRGMAGLVGTWQARPTTWPRRRRRRRRRRRHRRRRCLSGARRTAAPHRPAGPACPGCPRPVPSGAGCQSGERLCALCCGHRSPTPARSPINGQWRSK